MGGYCSDSSITPGGACTGDWDHDGDGAGATPTAPIARVTGAESKWKLSYKGEMSQDMDYQSTPAQVAEEINGFSALSGPVTVTGEGTSAYNGFPKYVITFDAADGDVAELETHTDGTDVVTIVTRANGWSIEGPIGEHLDTMQAGGTINVTAKEVCSFTVGDADGSEEYYFCYDGVCGDALTGTIATAMFKTHITTKIKDDNNVAILSAADASYTANTGSPAKDVFAITLPLGKSCDGLEMRVKTLGNTGEIVKSVDKHNNGKVFKITRSFVQVEEAAPGTATSGTAFTFTDGKGHSALAGASTVVINKKASGTLCAAHSGDFGFPIHRTISDFGTAHGGAAAVATIAAITNANANTHCDYALRRYVITLDSMPTASAHTAEKNTVVQIPSWKLQCCGNDERYVREL